MSEVSYGYCHCGCGQKTKLASTNGGKQHWVKGEPLKYINGHNQRGSNNFNWKGGVSYKTAYCRNHPRAISPHCVREHILRAERALGRPLPPKAVIHHVNGSKSSGQLVICQDAYCLGRKDGLHFDQVD